MTEAAQTIGSAAALGGLAHLVDCVDDLKFCEALAGVVSGCLDYDNLIILAYSGATTPQEIYRQTDSPICYAQIGETYLPSHYVLDPFYTAHLKKVPRGLYRLDDVAPDKFKSTTYFLEYYAKTTLVDEIALFAYTRTGWTITACFGRDHLSNRRFERRQLADLGKIAEIITALMEKHWADYDPVKAPAEIGSDDMIDGLTALLKVNSGIDLTRRQLEVGLLILQGHSSRSIALRLGISWQTVKVFRKQLYARCQISSQAELFALLLPLIGAQDAAFA